MENYRERNRMIYEERLQGATLEEIGKKYNLCRDRVRTIFIRESRNIAREDEIIRQLLYAMSDDFDFATRAYNVLCRAGIDSKEKLLRSNPETIRKLRGCGAKMEKLIMQVKEALREDEMDDKMSEM